MNTLGKYINKDTLIHRLDPRGKFVMLIILMVVVFLINPSISQYQIVGWASYATFLIFLLILYKIAKLKLKMIFNSLKPMWFMIIFLFIVNIFVYKDGTLLIPKWWIFEIHLDAVLQTLKIFLRLLLLIMLSTLFTATTKPLDITIAIDDLFAWLKIFKVNVSILSMIISLALRFIPTILDETYKIMKAQASRGVDFKNGKFKEKVIAITSLIIPLFISAISRSDELANALTARNYNPLAKRSKYRQLKWKAKDSIALILSTLTFSFSIALLVLINNNTLVDFISDSIIKGWFNL
ncbi:MAG: energy-coupling factor transporter transmembrane component T [Candidatus Caccosoma sp.]|nr:energy-coupling factor transporter transmembrane component T [Candidatus Caccosoma sp.]